MDLLKISQMIRQTRKSQGLTVQALATQAGFSKTFISRLENFRITPSLKALGKVAEALGLNMADFFQEDDQVPKYQYGHLQDGQEIIRDSEAYAMRYFSLAYQKIERVMDPFIIEYHPSEKERGFNSHDTEEFFVVLEGEIDFFIYDRSSFKKLGVGGTVYLDANIPHQAKLSDGESYARAMVIYGKNKSLS